MKITTDCPQCGKIITLERESYQGWFFCRSCQCIFISRKNLQEAWPSLYEALKHRKFASRSMSSH